MRSAPVFKRRALAACGLLVLAVAAATAFRVLSPPPAPAAPPKPLYISIGRDGVVRVSDRKAMEELMRRMPADQRKLFEAEVQLPAGQGKPEQRR